MPQAPQVMLFPVRHPKDQHSNPIGSCLQGAAPAASFLRLDPNRPGLRLIRSPRSSSAGPLPIEIYRDSGAIRTEHISDYTSG
jgi:hypothetical protein